MTLVGSVFRNKQRRKVAQDLSAYRGVVLLGTAAEEGSLDPFQIPANANLAISVNVETAQGDVTVTYGDRTLQIAGGPSDKLFKLGWLERGHQITINRASGSPSGDVGLYVLDDWGRGRLVASGTFS